jgi:transposase-like protein
MGKETRFSPEVKERAVRLVYEQQKESDQWQWAITCSVASRIGCSAETLRHWIRKDEVDSGKREGLTTSEREHMKHFEKINRKLKKASEILRLASAYFANAELDRRVYRSAP